MKTYRYIGKVGHWLLCYYNVTDGTYYLIDRDCLNYDTAMFICGDTFKSLKVAIA